MDKMFTLFYIFFKIGITTFGGGYAMIPIIQKEIVDKHKFITEEEVLDIFSISEATPGVIAVNAATFVGYKIAGFFGSVFATIGVCIPSFIIIIAVWFFLGEFKENQWIQYALDGIKIGVIVLLIGAVLKLSKVNKFNIFNISLVVITIGVNLFTNINIILLILFGVLAGVIYNIFINKNKFNDLKEE